MINFSKLVLPLVVVLSAIQVQAEVKMRGDFRLRQEYLSHTDFASERGDTLLRLRPELTWTPTPEITVLAQPQAAKAFGEPAYLANSTASNRAADSSGGLNSDVTPVTFHQAWADWKPHENISLRMGRQIITYGDELVIGGADWANLARSFDAVRVLGRHALGTTDLFVAKLKDTNIATPGPGDKDFYGFYNALKLNPWVDQFDLYLLEVHDSSTVAHPGTLIAMGVRAKSKINDFEYRVEATRQDGSHYPAGYQFNPELGYTFSSVPHRPKVEAEYYYASGDYQQLYPSAHRFLGIGDELGRRNIRGLRVGLSAAFLDKLSVRADYYTYARATTDHPSYKIDGVTPIGTISRSGSTDVGSEANLIVKWQSENKWTWSLGYSHFFTGSYLDDQDLGRDPQFAYLQFETPF